MQMWAFIAYAIWQASFCKECVGSCGAFWLKYDPNSRLLLAMAFCGDGAPGRCATEAVEHSGGDPALAKG